MKILILFSIITSLFSSNAFAQANGSVTGTVRDAQNSSPITAATVSVSAAKRSVITDSLGRYSFSNLKPGVYTITVTAIGFETSVRYDIPITSGNTYEVSFDLNTDIKINDGVTVTPKRKTARATSIETPLSVQRLTTEEIKSNPGGNFDISRVVQSLPGITGSDGLGTGYRNDIIIRGGAPYENVYYLDGIEVPVINHFSTQGSAGGPQGILNVSFIEDLKLSTSSFDARYDNALSGVFDFKQKNGNTKKVQGNVRLGASEIAATFDGPLNKKRDFTFLASARRSYLQLLFQALDLPIRPDYYDFQYKVSYTPNTTNSFSLIGIGAIDHFTFGSIKKPTLNKYNILDNAPLNNQWNYTVGGTWKRSMKNGFFTVALSRNTFNSDLIKYDGNDESFPSKLRLKTNSRETENKLRVDVSQNLSGWKITYGASGQLVSYYNNSYIRRRAEIKDANGNIIQPADIFQYNTSVNFSRYGIYLQAGKRFFANRVNISAGVRTDGNNFTNDGNNLAGNLSPRIAFSYAINKNLSFNTSAGSYTRLPPYTVLGFQQNNIFINKNADYIRTNHYVAGFEYLPKATLRFTLEGFYKRYSNVPASLRNGISLNNLGTEFTALGNEPITSSGKGEAYGVEVFAQQKLTKRLFGFGSYTYVISRFSGLDGSLIASAWDNRHLFSFTVGYKFNRNWELGLKYRFQGGLPYTPFDETASRLNYATQGIGILDYSKFNQKRLTNFQQSDVRLDKKWNLKRVTIDVFIDIQNWTSLKSPVLPKYTFDRDLVTGAFITTNNQPLAADGSNAVPAIIIDNRSTPLPTIGFIVEF
jgi:hypothetical protein